MPKSLPGLVRPLEVLLFTRHLATMTGAGIPLSEALSSLADHSQTAGFRKTVSQLAQDIENGQSLASALAKHPRYFDKLYQNLVAVSEKTGSLPEHLSFMAKQLAKNYTLKQKIKTALLYPNLVISAAVIMSGFVSFFVLPQLVDFFDAFEVELPLSTRILLFIANLFKDHGLIIFVSILAATAAFHIIIRLPIIKPKWHAMVLRLPFLGKFLRTTQQAQFSRNLGVLLHSGIPVTEALSTTSHTLSNITYQTAATQLAAQVSTGATIADSIEKHFHHLFPSIISKMIRVGEKTGNLDDSLLYLSEFYEEEIDTNTRNLTALLEPALLLTIGLAVGFLALAIISPIYELTGSIRTS